MNTQTTPETDVWEAYCDECYYHMWRLRRKTERGWYDGFHIHTGEEAKGLCETLNKLERELAEAREESIRWMSIAEGRGRTDDDDTGKAMSNLIRQRDEAREQLAAARAEIDEIHATGGCSYIELHKVTAQRDRLAVAIRKHKDAFPFALADGDVELYEALQSLTQKEV